MTFQVIIRQYPEAMDPMLTKAEMSADGLHLKLAKDITGVVAINGEQVTMAQRRALLTLGSRWPIVGLEKAEGGVLVTAMQGGHSRQWVIDPAGIGHYVDNTGLHLPPVNPKRHNQWRA